MKGDWDIWYRNHKEFVDQPLHFLMCFLPVIACIIHPAMAAIPAIMFALSREYYQHDRVVFFNRDLYFAYAGALTGAALLLLL